MCVIIITADKNDNRLHECQQRSFFSESNYIAVGGTESLNKTAFPYNIHFVFDM